MLASLAYRAVSAVTSPIKNRFGTPKPESDSGAAEEGNERREADPSGAGTGGEAGGSESQMRTDRDGDAVMRGRNEDRQAHADDEGEEEDSERTLPPRTEQDAEAAAATNSGAAPAEAHAAGEETASEPGRKGDDSPGATAAKAAATPAPAPHKEPEPSSSSSLSPSKKKRKARPSAAGGGPSSLARVRRTRAGQAVAPVERAPSQDGDANKSGEQDAAIDEVEDDPARGADGKEYWLAGIYWSSTSPSKKPSTTRPRPSSSSSASASTLTPTDWRLVTPTRTSTFPPPVLHGQTLLDNDEEKKPFRLPFDILRDHYYAGEEEGGRGDGRKGKRKAGGRLQQEEGAGPEQDDESDPTASSSTAPLKRGGKGGEKMTAADRQKLEQSKKPDPYRYTSKNIYFGRGPDKAAIPAVCSCKPPARVRDLGCGADCINRLMQYCCEPKLCPCGPERCGNPPLSKREGVPEGKDGLRVIWTGNRGFGLKTMVPIKKGDFVIEYRGEIISKNESYRRVLTDYKDSPSYYFMDYDGWEVVDAGQRGNAARFINHSCGPNLEVVRWRLAQFEEYQMGLFALHDIPAETELTYNYGWQDFSSLAPQSAETTALAAAGVAATNAPSASTTETGTTAAEAHAEAVGLGNGTAIDPARQRCYCGAPECSGFLGGGGGGGREGGEGGGRRKAAGGGGGRKGKGKRKAAALEEQQEATASSSSELGRPPQAAVALAFAPPKSKPSEGAEVDAGPERAAASDDATPPARPSKKARLSSAGEGERGRPAGGMRSGREAARKAAERLVGRR